MRELCLRRLGLLSMACLALLMGGCASTMGPKMPKELNAPSQLIYAQADFKTDADAYHKAIADKDLALAQTLRNQIAYRVMADAESGYGKFEMNLSTRRAGFETGSDAIQLGLAAAATVVGGADVKELLAASLTAFQGTRLSYDKNWYREKSTEALLSQMRASRKTKQAQLIMSLATRDVASYPLEAVWIDLVSFYYAGTVPSALVEISSAAGASAERATVTLNNTIASLTPTTAAQAKQATDIRSVYEKLSAAAMGADAAKSASAIQSLKSILMAVGAAPADGATTQDLLAALRSAMSDARTDNDKLTKLTAAVAAANVQ